ncbi:energy transducer TonB [Sphingomonas sp.]|uniref:energy transducer TonB n=1 Tax=Sphingomonas sp. TaxID=28214 RepID=UPI0017A2D4D4|nr:energy transducer TonB [Sphingomonas sp.]MBA3512178.1 energy transducer TonB [Sphingomonas sp.]
MAYQASHKPDRIKALAGVLAVHVALGAVILTGLNVRTVATTIERLRTFDITELPPPPPPPPPPSPTPERAKEKEGAAAKKALPTPVVAPPPKIVLPAKSPVVASRVPSTGSAATAGAAASGTGTGAGGSGTGLGGGGRGSGGSGDGFTPAQRISKIPDREYRRFVTASGMRRGRVGITVKVNTDGRLSNCRVARSSGNSSVDSLMCSLTLQHVRFRPARDPQGRPVAQDITWYPDWTPNR